ncbi:hypothetical protein [Grimontia hollisae]|uniref:hypothetical protein n=1 Tax=Grimontia hollisae TaxID=673 RepID=UPI0012AD1A8A|nr:hypothetical protein [Grimontia hollisae]
MYELVSAVVLAGVLGAQAVLTLVLLKGDICPGQRGRLHKAFWYLVAGWGVTIPFFPFSVLPFITLGIFSLRSKSGKTRQSGPVPLLHLSNAFGVLVLVVTGMEQGVLTALLMLVQVLLVGTVTAHCLMVKARSRLQAFHRILPVTGIVAAMLTAITLAVASQSMEPAAAESMVTSVLVSLGLAVAGVLVWVSHLLRQKAPHLAQLCVSLLVIGCASGVALSTVI